MGLWISQGIVKGENSFSVMKTSDETIVSLSISQDSIVAITTNALGWTVLREPNVASLVDAGVVVYDNGRSGLGEIIPPETIPTWINPAISYSTIDGWDFSW